MPLSPEFEKYAESFPEDQQFRLIDPARRFWNSDRLEWTFNERDATHFPARHLERISGLAIKYSEFDPLKIMIDPVNARPAILRRN